MTRADDVIACEDCNILLCLEDSIEIEYGDMKRKIFTKNICKKCYSELQEKKYWYDLEDQEYQEYLETLEKKNND